MHQQLKNVILIGSMKCGTTTLYEYLIQHPEIAEGVQKETHYFANYKMGNLELKIEKYNDLFQVKKGQHKFTLDASTGYTRYPSVTGVPKRIKEYGLNPYFIYIVRNPIERIKSHYNYMRKDLTWKDKIDSQHLVNVSKYYMQLEQFTKYFPKEYFLVIDFDDLKEDPKGLCNKIFKFIGASEFKIKIDTKTVKNKTIPINRTQINIIRKLSGFGKYSPSIINKTIKFIIRKILPPKEISLKEKQSQKAIELLKEDMEMLEKEYKINTYKWRI